VDKSFNSICGDLIATTNAGGAGNWHQDLNQYFQHREIYILPDNDVKGEEHARKVYENLKSVASEVRILRLPGLPEKGDVSDWIANGGTLDKLVDFLRAAPRYEDAPADSTRSKRIRADILYAEVEAEAWAGESDEPAEGEAISPEDFYAYMPTHSYIFVPTREPWSAASVNARIAPIAGSKANEWLDKNRPVEQMTWAPDSPMVIKDKLVADGGWIDWRGVSCFNLYRPPTIHHGNAAMAQPWVDHVRKVYGEDAGHIIRWLAHRVQRPGEKINHALVLGGEQGIGKDTMLEPVKHAVGPWNFQEVSPQQLLGRFNGFAKSVILRISEARDLGDVDRFKLYDHLKVYAAAPPDVLRVDEKNLREHSVFNVSGVIITTNYKTDGIYLPADDRRHFVAWSDLTKEQFADSYWNGLWDWYRNGGIKDVVAYLATLNISAFDPKAPPPKTAAFWQIVDANRAPEDAELSDALDRMEWPNATTLDAIVLCADAETAIWLRERKNRRSIPHKLDKVGYVTVRNDAANDGLWSICGKRQAAYAKKTLSVKDQIAAVQRLIR
jgi:hypothetical protein